MNPPPRTTSPPNPIQPRTQKPHPVRGRSKIARLPADKRELVNRLLRDGALYADIIKNLRQHGHHLNKANLSRWHAGGFQDWLAQQTYLEEIRGRLDFASRILNTQNAELLDQAAIRIALTRMSSLLLRFDPAVLHPKLADNPAAYTRLLNALCNLTETAVHLQSRREERFPQTFTPTTAQTDESPEPSCSEPLPTAPANP